MRDNDHQFERLKAIFEGDGEEIRRQFILAGLLLTIFEQFKRYVVSCVDGFFSNHFEIKDGEITCRRAEEFKAIIREKGGGKPGQHANKDFRAALHWFYDLNAIDKDEFEELERLYTLRNEIGHELLRFVADDRKPQITLFDVLFALSVYIKVVRWWVREVEIATDPDMDEEKYDSIDWDGIESNDTILLRGIVEKALAGDPQWEELQTMIRKNQST